MKILLSKIKENPINSEIYNKTDISDLANSIKDIGLLENIIVDKNYTIISGHRRYQACKYLNLKYVEVTIKNIKDSDNVLYIIHYNKHRIKTTKELLNEINQLRAYYSQGQGFRSDLTSDNVVKSRELISNELNISEGNIY